MIFVGDIACPENKVQEFIDCVQNLDVFRDEIVILNLEANILDIDAKQKPLTLFNSPRVIDAFCKSKKLIVSLANNHMFDYPSRILSTKSLLEKKGCGVFGVVEEDGSVKPYEYVEGSSKYAFFGHCWSLYTHTNTNKENSVRIVDDDYEDFSKIVINYMKENPDTKVYCFMHWNYDREKLVMPMHIEFSHYLVDKGVAGIIGSHSHRPQGAEIYNEKPIAYGLGNFYLPSGVFFNGKLSYPMFSKETYCLSIKDDDYKLLWFDTDIASNPVSFKFSESLSGCKISSYSDFVNMGIRDYEHFYHQNRSKKILVPNFSSYIGRQYKRDLHFAICRIKLLRKLSKMLKK